jgi:hypothetical protein
MSMIDLRRRKNGTQDDVVRPRTNQIQGAEGGSVGNQSEHRREAEEQPGAGRSETLAAPSVISDHGDNQRGLEFDENAIAHPEDRTDLQVVKTGAASFVSKAPTTPGRAEDKRSKQNLADAKRRLSKGGLR